MKSASGALNNAIFLDGSTVTARIHTMIHLQLSSQWTINTPTVFRYVPKEFEDSFFASGSLRLSSFSRFATHADEQRRDTNEGRTMLVARTSDQGGQTLNAWASHGHNAYVLCGTIVHRPSLQQEFGCDGCIRINDTTAFANAVSRHIPGFIAGLEGPCIYRKLKILEKDLGFLNLVTDQHESTLDLSKMAAYLREVGQCDVYFLKSSNFAHQVEYRWLWLTADSAREQIDIICPEARKFCSTLGSFDE